MQSVISNHRNYYPLYGIATTQSTKSITEWTVLKDRVHTDLIITKNQKDSRVKAAFVELKDDNSVLKQRSGVYDKTF